MHDIAQVYKSFEFFDADFSGTIDKNELRAGLSKLGMKANEKDDLKSDYGAIRSKFAKNHIDTLGSRLSNVDRYIGLLC